MNIVSTVCWCNTWDKQSLQCIGAEAVCIRQSNMIKFLNVKTNAISYFKAENATIGLGIDVYAGHPRFPFFAISESILRPNIYIYQYPEMTKYGAVPTNDIIKYEDMCFSEHDLLITLSGYPDYIIYVCNFRSGNIMYQVSTYTPSTSRSLLIESHLTPTITLHSASDEKLLFFAICSKDAAEASLFKVSEVLLGKSFRECKKFFISYGDDASLYVIDHFGELSVVEQSCFTLKSKWMPDKTYRTSNTPLSHMLLNYKHGFFILNRNMAFFVKKKANEFVTEWVISQVNVEINQVLCSPNGDLYGIDELSTLYKLTGENAEATFEPTTNVNMRIKQFSLIKGIKEEVILLMYYNGTLAVCDLLRGHVITTVQVEDVTAIAAHRYTPYVAVGTKNADLMIISFEKVASPVILNSLNSPEGQTHPIENLKYSEPNIVYRGDDMIFHIISAHSKPPIMRRKHDIRDKELNKRKHIVEFYVVDGDRLLVFLSPKKEEPNAVVWNYATELWIYCWARGGDIQKIVYDLPAKYIHFTLVPPSGRWVSIEICAVLLDSVIIHIFTLSENNTFQKSTALNTLHFSNIVGIAAAKNLITWGIDGVVIHLRKHKRSVKPFIVSRPIKIFFTPRGIGEAEECYNSKYLIIFFPCGRMRVMRLPSLSDYLRDNTQIQLDEEIDLVPYEAKITTTVPFIRTQKIKETEFLHGDRLRKEMLEVKIKRFAEKVGKLIDYDMSVTGKTKGIFKKFCFNYQWLDKLTEEAHKLCAIERESLVRAIEDQSRIRDWIMHLVTYDAVNISYKVRSIFAHANFENFAIRRKVDLDRFDKYRFYDMELFKIHSIDEELSKASSKTATDELGEEEEEEKFAKDVYIYRVEGKSVYDHIMSPWFTLQSKDIVTSYQVYNDDVKYRYYINEALKTEFNKLFHEAQIMKQETIDNVVTTNAALNKIYDNMNIMLRLLNMEQFKKPELSLPTFAKDEVIKCIMEVDDCEIKAINRRKPKVIDTGGKRGRLLLWSFEFWERALIVMMDGVIEKLWEEEIKKDIPIPEFVLKKEPHEFNLEEQKQFRAYEEAVRQLQEDRKKYLRILHEREATTQEQKKQQILKLNTRVSELMRLKLKYDYALKQNRLRLLNLKIINFNRMQWRDRINMFREDEYKLNSYIITYNKLVDFWEKNVIDTKAKLDAQLSRDKAVERQFRSHFLNTVPHASTEMTKLFKKHPKITQRNFNTMLMCFEAANKLGGKMQRHQFPLPPEIFEFFANVEELDSPKNCPQQVDLKSWEAFTKLRRQKIESEIRLKGIGYLMSEANADFNRFTREVNMLKEAKLASHTSKENAKQRYIEVIRNMTLQVTLTLGQVEISMKGVTGSLETAVLMHIDDINSINAMITEAGNKKIKAMQRVAEFRRQIIFKEWEHKVTKLNIAYLNYMLEVIDKCKVTIEFLNILRNWEKVKQERPKYEADGAIERVIEQKIAAFRKHIERVTVKIETTRQKTLKIKRQNRAINEQIERMKVDVAFFSINRDNVMEEKREREKQLRMHQIKSHRVLLDTVRSDYVRILELNTILELLRLRTYPTLGPAPPQCPPLYNT